MMNYKTIVVLLALSILVVMVYKEVISLKTSVKTDINELKIHVNDTTFNMTGKLQNNMIQCVSKIKDISNENFQQLRRINLLNRQPVTKISNYFTETDESEGKSDSINLTDKSKGKNKSKKNIFELVDDTKHDKVSTLYMSESNKSEDDHTDDMEDEYLKVPQQNFQPVPEYSNLLEMVGDVIPLDEQVVNGTMEKIVDDVDDTANTETQESIANFVKKGSTEYISDDANSDEIEIDIHNISGGMVLANQKPNDHKFIINLNQEYGKKPQDVSNDNSYNENGNDNENENENEHDNDQKDNDVNESSSERSNDDEISVTGTVNKTAPVVSNNIDDHTIKELRSFAKDLNVSVSHKVSGKWKTYSKGELYRLLKKHLNESRKNLT